MRKGTGTIAFWVETPTAGAGHWRIAYEAYKEAKGRGYDTIVLSATSDRATSLYPFDPQDIKQLTLPPMGDEHYYPFGDVNLPKPNEAFQQDYADQMVSILSRQNVAAFITEQQPIGTIHRGWFLKPLGKVYDYLESKSPRPVFGAIVRPNTQSKEPHHFQGGVSGVDEVVERVRRLDFLAVRGFKEMTDLADNAVAARHPDVASKLRYVGYIAPQVETQDARSGIVVSAGSNWFPDNPEVYVHAVQAFQWLDSDLQQGGMQVLIPRDAPAGALDLLTAMAHDVEAVSEGRITVGYNLESKEFDKLIATAELFVLRPGNTASEVIVHGGNVVAIPRILGKEPEQMVRGINLAKKRYGDARSDRR